MLTIHLSYACTLCKQLCIMNPYDAQAYFLYDPIFPSSNLMVLNHTVHHC